MLANVVDCSLNKATRHKLRAHRRPIFPLEYFDEKLNIQEMKDRMEHDLGTGKLKYHWANSLPREAICFVKYTRGKGRGCPHHISSVAFRCLECKKEVGCCYCHQDLFELDEEHAFKIDRVAICTKCRKEHTFD